MDVREKLIELLTNSQQLDVLDRATKSNLGGKQNATEKAR